MWVILFSTLELSIPATCHVLGLLPRPWQTGPTQTTAQPEGRHPLKPSRVWGWGRGAALEASPHAAAAKLWGAAESDLEGDGACPEGQLLTKC